jgi:hypothetical protein
VSLWTLVDEAMARKMTWAEVQRRLTRATPWYELWGTHALDEAAWREYVGPPPDWQRGISVEEVLAFGLRRGYEAYMQLLPDEELQRQLALAVARGEDPSTRTTWLERYAGLLVDERRRRRGAA